MKKELDERLYRYAVDIIKFCDSFPKDTSSQTILRQLIRSGTSVTANVREAKGASSKRDYINFYTHALKSANETEFWILLARDAREIKNDALLEETIQIAKILAASIITMKRNNK